MTKKFLGRYRELEKLNQLYRSNRFECVVVYGRRRVGKTALIREFCRDKPTVFFSALESTETLNRRALSCAISRHTQSDSVLGATYDSFEGAFAEITQLSKEKQLVFVIDEFPYLAHAFPAVSSILQHLIDDEWQQGKLFLILCGSSMSFMENQVLGYQSPLYGRRTAQMKIERMGYRESAEFHPELSCEENALIYGITGGIPLYVEMLNVCAGVDEALRENFFSEFSPLHEETSSLLKQELRDPALYSAILQAVAEGASRQNEISTKTGISSSMVANYLKVLQSLGLVRKETPVTEKVGKKTIYSVEDLFFRFWYRFAPVMAGVVSRSAAVRVYEQAVKRYLPDYMGRVFEQMCREYLEMHAGELPVLCGTFGRWWGSDPSKKRPVEIDIVGVPVSGKEFLVASCKYTREKVGTGELALLKEYVHAFGKGEKYRYWLFSKSGFSAELIQLEKTGQVTLVSLQDMYA